MYLNINLKWKGSFKTRSKWAVKQHKFGNVISDSLEFGWVTSRLKVHRESSINLNWNWSVEPGSFIFKAIQNHRQKRWNMRFGVLLFVIQHQIVLKLLECDHGVVDCQSELKLVCGSREFYFLEPFKIKDRSGIMWTWELLLRNPTSDCLETTWVSSWRSGLSIWIKIVLWKRSFLFRAIKNHRQVRYNVNFGELLLCNSTSDCLETAWVSSWGSGLPIWIEIVLWKQGYSFWKPSKITNRRREYEIWKAFIM